MFAPKRHAKTLLSLVLAASLGFGAPAAFAAQQANGDSVAKAEKAEAVTKQVADDADASDGISLTSATSTIADEQGLSSLANSANAWQVVNKGYTGNGTSNKTPSPDGNVAVQKNVVPAGIENEFLVYLSIDYKAALKNYFESATYEGTTSNNYHSETPGKLVHQMTGNMNVSISTTSGKKSGYFTVKTPSGETVAEKVHLYWSQANKVTFFLTVDSSNYVLFAVQVTDGSDSNVTLSTEAWDLIRQEAVKTALNQVTDTMGDNIEYVETVASDGATSYDDSSRTLTWMPQVKADCETESSTSGSETTTWYRNAAELVYKVKLTPPPKHRADRL